MSKCAECGRALNALNSVRFTERECVGFDHTGKKEYQTTSFTVCAACAVYVEKGMVDGRTRARVQAIHDRRRRRGWSNE